MYTKKNGRVTFKSNRRSNFKRNNYGSKGRNRGNVSQQYNKYLKLAKDTFSSGDRIQAEYYYQFTDHYYRLMLELGINLEDQDTNQQAKTTDSEFINSVKNEANESAENEEEKLEVVDNDKEDEEQSIESVPFMSKPVKKKRSRTIK